jgi:hypothetical protein
MTLHSPHHLATNLSDEDLSYDEEDDFSESEGNLFHSLVFV